MRCVRSARRLPMALMCSTSMVGHSIRGAFARRRDSDRNASSSCRDVLGLVVVQHVAGRSDDVALARRRPGQPLVELGLGVARAPPARGVGVVALDPQHRRGDPLPALEHFVDLVRAAGCMRLWAGSPSRMRSPPSSLRVGATSAAPARRRASARSSGLVLRSRAATASRSGVGAQLRRRLQLVEPLARCASAPAAGCVRGMPKPSRLTRRRIALGPHAGVEHHDVAAHAVAEQVDRPRLGAEAARRATSSRSPR